MANTIRELIILDFISRLATITVANGYNTGIGAAVIRARKKIDPDELPATVVWPGPERAEHQYGYLQCVMQIKVEGIVEFGATNPSVMAEQILGDIKKCILQPGNVIASPDTGWCRSPDYIDSISYTGGGVQDYPDEGQLHVGVYCEFDVGYTTKINDPYAQ